MITFQLGSISLQTKIKLTNSFRRKTEWLLEKIFKLNYLWNISFVFGAEFKNKLLFLT